MNRREGQRRLEQIRGEDETAARDLRTLIRDCQAAPAPPAPQGRQPSWQSEAAEALAALLCEAVAATLPAAASAESRERLEAAVALGGPDGLATLDVELAERVEASRLPRAELALLRARRQCLELKLRCLDHLDAVFRAERAQP